MATKHDTIAMRLAQILTKLNNGERLTEKELAEEFNVSIRTIYRDMNERLIYLPIDKVDGYYILDEKALGKLSFKDIKNFAAISGVKSLFPSLTNEFLTDILNTKINPVYQVNHTSYESLEYKFKEFENVSSAILKNNQVSFTYNQKPRCVNPYKLINNNGIWYLLADEDGTLKTFTFSKIDKLNLLKTSFKPNKEFQSEIAKNENNWLSDDVIDVTLEVDKPLIEYFTRRDILSNQTIIEQNQEKLIISTKASYEEEILGVVKYGLPHIKILSPIYLQEKLQNTLKNYIN